MSSTIRSSLQSQASRFGEAHPWIPPRLRVGRERRCRGHSQSAATARRPTHISCLGDLAGMVSVLPIMRRIRGTGEIVPDARW